MLQTAKEGIETHEGPMPFLFPWHQEEEIFIESSRYYWSSRASFTSESWALMLVVRHSDFADRPLGMQDINAVEFPKRRVATTGSWLGREFQDRGIGTLMRQSMASFAFDELGAEVLGSGTPLATLPQPRSAAGPATATWMIRSLASQATTGGTPSIGSS